MASISRSLVVLKEGGDYPCESRPELVERKGIGHPDTLADLVADNFIATYAAHSLNEFGCIPNLVVDKVLLVGGLSQLRFGSSCVLTRIAAHLVGKITPSVGSRTIPISDLFRDAVTSVLVQAVGVDITHHVDCYVHNNPRETPDHEEAIYIPQDAGSIRQGTARIGDTSYVAAHFPDSPIERLTILSEQYLTSKNMRQRFPEIGTDVKILATRINNSVEMVVCVPFLAQATPSASVYSNVLAELEISLQELFASCELEVGLHLNPKDRAGGNYLTAFGTSLDKGDQGVVGRGNRVCGFTSAGRNQSSDASPGKNPFLHAAKIYQAIAGETAFQLATEFECSVSIIVVAHNGDIIVDPSKILVMCGPGKSKRIGDMTKRSTVVMDELLRDHDQISHELASSDPVRHFVEHGAYVAHRCP